MTTVPSSELYRAVEMERYRAGSETELVHLTRERRAHLVPAQIARIVDRCRGFKTLAEHASVLSGGSGTDTPAGADRLAQILREAAQAGFLVSQADLVGADAAPDPQPPPLHTIAIVSCDRPTPLRLAAATFTRNAQRAGRAFECIVMDDSHGEGTRRTNVEHLEDLAARRQGEFRYAGPSEKLEYAGALARLTGVPSDVVRFALLGVAQYGCTIGANRNAVLLDTVGERILCVDDDTVCRAARHPGARPGVAFVPDSDPTEFWFFGSRDAARAAAAFKPVDFLGHHEEILGRRVDDIARAQREVRVGEICQHLFGALRTQSGRVAVTLNGVVGDSAMPGPAGCIVTLAGESRDRMLSSPTVYQRALVSREVFRAAPQVSISHSALCMNTSVGIDNRQLLPPFIPVLRNEDGLFGVALTTLADDRFLAYLPWAVLHEAAPRTYPADYVQLAMRRNLNELIMFTLPAAPKPLSGDSAETRMRALGQFLVDLASRKVAAFDDFLRVHTWKALSGVIAQWEAHLRASPQCPDYWRDDMRRCLDGLRATLTDPDLIVADDVLPGAARDTRLRATQSLFRSFGDLLSVWPNLVAGAAELRAAGVRLSHAVTPRRHRPETEASHRQCAH